MQRLSKLVFLIIGLALATALMVIAPASTFAQSSCTQAGQGAPNQTIAQAFRNAYSEAPNLIGQPMPDWTGCVHDWYSVWTQDFIASNGARTNLMYNPRRQRVFRVYGNWLKSYVEHGGPSHKGMPIENTQAVGGGEVQGFELMNGYRAMTLFRKAGSPTAWVVAYGIREKYGETGFERGPLGWPTSHEYGIPGGARSDFENGSILWLNGRAEVRLNNGQEQSRKVVVYLAGLSSNLADARQDYNKLRERFRLFGGVNPDTTAIILYSYNGGELNRDGSWTPADYSCASTLQSIDRSVEALQSTLLLYSAQHPGTDFVLVGHSLGGIVAWKTTVIEDVRHELQVNNSRITTVITWGSPINNGGGALTRMAVNWIRDHGENCPPESEVSTSPLVESLQQSLPSFQQNRTNAQTLIDHGIGVVPYCSSWDLIQPWCGVEPRSGGLANLYSPITDPGINDGHTGYIDSPLLWENMAAYIANH